MSVAAVQDLRSMQCVCHSEVMLGVCVHVCAHVLNLLHDTHFCQILTVDLVISISHWQVIISTVLFIVHRYISYLTICASVITSTFTIDALKLSKNMQHTCMDSCIF